MKSSDPSEKSSAKVIDQVTTGCIWLLFAVIAALTVAVVAIVVWQVFVFVSGA